MRAQSETTKILKCLFVHANHNIRPRSTEKGENLNSSFLIKGIMYQERGRETSRHDFRFSFQFSSVIISVFTHAVIPTVLLPRTRRTLAIVLWLNICLNSLYETFFYE